MLILFETSAGYALFQLEDNKLLQEPEENLAMYFETVQKARLTVQLVDFENFADIANAINSTVQLRDSKIPHEMDSLLQRHSSSQTNVLLISEPKLGVTIMDKYTNIKCLYGTNVLELMRCIRIQMSCLLGPTVKEHLEIMNLLLSRALGHYKVQQNPNQIDTLVSHAARSHIKVEKQISSYIKICKSWYGNHFPELACLVSDDLTYLKLVQFIGNKSNSGLLRMSRLIDPTTEKAVKHAAETSAGVDVCAEFPLIYQLIENTFEIINMKTELEQYIELRMTALAPNLTKLVGSLFGAKFISHAGSLLSLAKKPSSTILLFGARKTLFAALKSNKPTPKYGIIYNTPFVQDAAAEDRPKMSRMLAGKIALAARSDAFKEEEEGEEVTFSADFGSCYLVKVEKRLQQLNEEIERRIIFNQPRKIKIKAKTNTNRPSFSNFSRNYKNSSYRRPIVNKRSYEKFIRSQTTMQIYRNEPKPNNLPIRVARRRMINNDNFEMRNLEEPMQHERVWRNPTASFTPCRGRQTKEEPWPLFLENAEPIWETPIMPTERVLRNPMPKPIWEAPASPTMLRNPVMVQRDNVQDFGNNDLEWELPETRSFSNISCDQVQQSFVQTFNEPLSLLHDPIPLPEWELPESQNFRQRFPIPHGSQSFDDNFERAQSIMPNWETLVPDNFQRQYFVQDVEDRREMVENPMSSSRWEELVAERTLRHSVMPGIEDRLPTWEVPAESNARRNMMRGHIDDRFEITHDEMSRQNMIRNNFDDRSEIMQKPNEHNPRQNIMHNFQEDSLIEQSTMPRWELPTIANNRRRDLMQGFKDLSQSQSRVRNNEILEWEEPIREQNSRQLNMRNFEDCFESEQRNDLLGLERQYRIMRMQNNVPLIPDNLPIWENRVEGPHMMHNRMPNREVQQMQELPLLRNPLPMQEWETPTESMYPPYFNIDEPPVKRFRRNNPGPDQFF